MEEEVLEEARKVRVRYSTIMNYIAQVYRLLLAILFAVIATRKLSVEEYGLWTTIFGVSGVLTSIYGIWYMWVTRFYARRRYDIVAATPILTMIYAPIAIALMALTGLYYASILGWGFEYFIVASLMIVHAGFNRYFRSIVIGSRPYIEARVNIIRDTVRVITVYILVVVFMQKLLGVLLSTIVAGFTSTILYVLFLRHEKIAIPKPMFIKKHIARILKNSYIPVLNTSSQLTTHIERPILTALSASTTATAYLGISYIPRSVILQSSQAFTSPLLSKLLRIPSREDIEDVLRLTFAINIGATAFILVMVKPILSLFRPEYMSAWPLFIIFSLESLVMVFANIFAAVSVALEKKDLYEEGLKLTDTPLFKINLARFLRNTLSVLAGSTAIATALYIGVKDPVLIALFYPISWFASGIPLLVYTYRLSKKKIHYSIPVKELLSSLLAATIASLYLYFSKATTIIIKNFWSTVPILLIHVAIYLAIYSIVLLALSKWFREFVFKAIKYYFS